MKNLLQQIKAYALLLLFLNSVGIIAQKSNSYSVKESSADIIAYNQKYPNSKLDDALKNTSLGATVDDIIKNKEKILINAYPTDTASVLKQDLEKIGATEIVIQGKLVLTAWVKASQLEILENIPSLDYATCNLKGKGSSSLISGPKNLGAVTGNAISQGDKAMLTDLLRDKYKVNGCGIKIGILSDSFNAKGDTEKGIKNGELPGKDNPNGFTTEVKILKKGPTGGTDEGRAMAEIIHDVAPGAEIYFYSASFGIFDFAKGFGALADAGVDIIVDDWFYNGEPVFQDGVLSQAIDAVSKRGVTVFEAAGNTPVRNVLDFAFKNSNVTPEVAEGVRFHDFGTGDTSDIFTPSGRIINVPALKITVPANGRFDFTLHWDEHSLFANPDIKKVQSDFILLPILNFPTGPQVRSDSNTFIDNIRFSNPFERVSFNNRENRVLDMRLVLILARGPEPQNVKLIDRSQNITISNNTLRGSIVGHTNAENAISVGSVNFNQTPAFNNALAPWFLTASGGTEILLDTNGDRLPAPILRNKPEIMAPHGVNNSFFGFEDIIDEETILPNFFGTSAAAPHAAAATALLLETLREENPNREKITPTEIKQALTTTAIDFNTKGFDFLTGNGYINTEAAIKSFLPTEPTVLSFQLIDAESKEVLRTLRDNDVVDLEKIPSKKAAIQTIIDFGDVRFKSISYTLKPDFQFYSFFDSASKDPYIAFDDNYYLNRLGKNGKYTLKASPTVFGRARLKPRTLSFSIINGEEPFNRRGADFSRFANPSFSFGQKSLNNQLSGTAVSPNPTNGTFTVSNTKGIKGVKIYDLYGKLVYEVVSNTLVSDIDFSEKGKGVYLVNILNNKNEIEVEKLVVK